MRARSWLWVGVLILMPAFVWADWVSGDPYKMHYPQLPDPNGWDVRWDGTWLADDWQCTETGPVNDIHFWVSWKGDQIKPLQSVGMAIYSDVPASAGPSHPGTLLWGAYNITDAAVAVPWGTGSQGWFDPLEGTYVAADHNQFWEVNVDLTKTTFPAFEQQQGTIYWLGLTMTGDNIGWKTSLQHFNDDAVYHNFVMWQELRSPITPHDSLDLSFVITTAVPEPATMALVGTALIGLIGVARKRRK